LGKFILPVVFLIIAIRGLRIYARTGLKGEFIVATACFIFPLSFYARDTIFMWIAFGMLNVGVIILYTSEKKSVKQIYKGLTLYKRIIGDYPQILNENESQRVNKISGVASGILCLLMAILFYRATTNNISRFVDKNNFDLVAIGILISVGILLIGFYLFKKVAK
jgi:heme/copper-type cytochrome/quinol oxidase subunit 1